MARPSTNGSSSSSSKGKAQPKNKSRRAAESDEEEQSEEDDAAVTGSGSSEESSEEEEAAPARKSKAAAAAASKKRAVEEDSDDDDDEEEEENEENSDHAAAAASRKPASGRGGAGSSTSARVNNNSSGGSGTTAGQRNGRAALSVVNANGASATAGSSDVAAAARSPLRTVSLNDTGSARRRLSGKVASRISSTNDLRRQSLPSALRKVSNSNGQDGDASFASSSASPARPAQQRPSTTANANVPAIRRTSAGFALREGGGIGALNAAANAALRRNGSGTSSGTGIGADDLLANASLPLPAISAEVMTTNYEEWMKMATDNVSRCRPLQGSRVGCPDTLLTRETCPAPPENQLVKYMVFCPHRLLPRHVPPPQCRQSRHHQLSEGVRHLGRLR